MSRRNPFLFRGPIPTVAIRERIGEMAREVAIPSYSEVLFLLSPAKGMGHYYESQSLLIQRSYSYEVNVASDRLLSGSRNPFLFRGPIPTRKWGKQLKLKKHGVAIPSYSEVLFLRGNMIYTIPSNNKVAIPSYSEVLFLQSHKP